MNDLAYESDNGRQARPTPPTPSDPSLGHHATAIGIGLIAGFGGGLASLGGGTLLIPQLTAFLRLPPLDARGTALAVALVNAITSATAYAIGGRVAWSPLIWAGLPALVIAPIAARLSQDWPTRGLRIAFGVVVMLGGAALFAVGSSPPDGIARHWPDLYLLLVGILSGAVAGLVGISGGPVLAPLFVLGLGGSRAPDAIELNRQFGSPIEAECPLIRLPGFPGPRLSVIGQRAQSTQL